MQIQLNNQFKMQGMKDYYIDDVLYQMEKVSLIEKKDSDYSLRHKKLINIISELTDSASTCHNSTTEEDSGSAGRHVESEKTFSQIMLDRWQKSNKITIPHVDQNDCMEHGQLVFTPVDHMHQHHAEFTQSSYNRLRSQEDAYKLCNYMQNVPKEKARVIIHKKTNSRTSIRSPSKKSNIHIQIPEFNRNFVIKKITYLHEKKEYKPETLFIACGIMDRFVQFTGAQNILNSQLVSLATICVLMSAKLEQPISPSFTRMIHLLTEEEQKCVNKKALTDLEAQILVKLGFDFNFPGPLQFLERYLRILNVDKVQHVYDIAFAICKLQLIDPKFLNFKPSQIAACSAILAINMHHKDRNKFEFFSFNGGVPTLNLSIWSQHVHQLTGYSLDSLRTCLGELVDFLLQSNFFLIKQFDHRHAH